MNENKLVLYFLTENVDIEKEKNEIEFLQNVGKVVIVSTNPKVPKYPGTRRLVLKPHPVKIFNLIVIWSKIVYLFGYIANTASDKGFIIRNVYTGNEFVRTITNILWRIKILPFVNCFFPTYDTAYFLPFKIAHIFKGKQRSVGFFKRVFVHDSLVLRLNTFPQIVQHARSNNIPTIGNVKSWDNPFYSQFATNANGYLVWSESMWKDVVHVHGDTLRNKFYHSWGARPFYKFRMKTDEYMKTHAPAKKASDSLIIGYAAAFCDELMGKYEIELIKEIAKKLQSTIPNAKVLIRPYPILPTSFYSDVTSLPNVDLVGIRGEAVDYTNDGKKIHKLNLGNDLERLEYLNECDCFLSIATSFSIEASIYGLPVVHFYLEPNEKLSEFENEFFKRILISDHILEYFNKEFVFADNYDDLVRRIKEIKTERKIAIDKSQVLLKRMGILNSREEWESSAQVLKKNLLKHEIKQRD